jgi:hypothetical protein
MAVVEVEMSGKGDLYKEFGALLERANKTNARPADVQKLTRFLGENEAENLWRRVAGVCRTAESSLLGDDRIPAGLRECWKRRMAALRRELGHADAPQMEKLLIEHAVVCWLRLNLIETFNAQILNQNVSLIKATFWEKRLVTAQQRFTRAVETLAKVRTLTAATRLIESRTEAKRVGSLRLMKAPEAA